MIDINFYKQNGYLILPDFIPEQECDLLVSRAKNIINEYWDDKYKTIFSTKDQSHAQHNYFLDSGNQIRLFFEEDAFDLDGELKYSKERSINKIGHALHKLDPVFTQFSNSTKMTSLANQLGLNNPLILQSMYICKQPFIGGEVTCHQDSTYLFVEDHPVTGFWFALEDATIDNGCLWAIPGGHRTPLKSRMIREKNDSVRTDVYDNSQWPLDQMVPLAVKRGSLIVLHGLLPHMSKTNTSGKSRHAYTLHMMSSEHRFAENNWLRL